MRLCIIRHAEPDYVNHTIIPPGHLEAQAWVNRLSKEGIDRIYRSPMEPALHTMQYTAELTGIEPAVEPWMSEWKVTNFSGGKTEAWNVDGESIRGTLPFPMRNGNNSSLMTAAKRTAHCQYCYLCIFALAAWHTISSLILLRPVSPINNKDRIGSIG
jgi:broad specificity phosphatase PhoE